MTNREFREALEDRTAQYAVRVFKFLRALPYDVAVKVIANQLGKSASSIGANYHEARVSSKVPSLTSPHSLTPSLPHF